MITQVESLGNTECDLFPFQSEYYIGIAGMSGSLHEVSTYFGRQNLFDPYGFLIMPVVISEHRPVLSPEHHRVYPKFPPQN